MNPRLAAIAGKLEGAVFPIGDRVMVIGRETAADVSIADASVSRRHSQIEREGSQLFIADLDSLNGTFINDVPVKRRVLEHGDRIRIGDSQFLFLMHDDEVHSKSSEVKIEDAQGVSSSTVQVRFDDAFYLMARDLSALMKVSTTINAIRGLEDLQKTLLELLFEVVPAQRGAILLRAANATKTDADFISVFGLDRLRGADDEIKVSRTIAQRVLKEGTAVLAGNLAEEIVPVSESLSAAQTGSLLCVPLVMLERTLGVVYLETNQPGVHFNKDHLQLVCAIGAITAVAIENARHFEWLENENQRLLADINIEHNMVGESPALRQV